MKKIKFPVFIFLIAMSPTVIILIGAARHVIRTAYQFQPDEDSTDVNVESEHQI